MQKFRRNIYVSTQRNQSGRRKEGEGDRDSFTRATDFVISVVRCLFEVGAAREVAASQEGRTQGDQDSVEVWTTEGSCANACLRRMESFR